LPPHAFKEFFMTNVSVHRLLLALLVSLLLASPRMATADEPAAQAAEQSFTVALLPDTQFYSLRFPETYVAQTKWIKERVKEDNVKFVIHLGDIVHNNTEEEWRNADRAMKILDGVVPYSVAPGNHDFATVERQLTRDSSLYNKYFPYTRYEKEPWFGGHKGDSNDNNYCFFEAAGMKFMVVSLEFAPSDEALEWAASVVKKHSDRRVIVATHCYMRPNGRDMSCARDYKLDGNSGQQIWEKLVHPNENVFLAVSGHVLGVGLLESTNAAGGKVIEMLTDYQGLSNGGDGWLRTLKFVPGEKKIYVRAYSPKLDMENTEPAHTYTLDYDFGPAALKKAG
jgi:hypothetical protein